MNRIYETDISVSVHVGNVPEGVALENDGRIPVRAIVRGEGTDLFGVMFNDGVDVAVDYSEMRRNGGRLTMPSGLVFSRLNELLGLSLSLKSILADSLVANVQQATAVVPVRRGRLDLGMADGCELVSVKYLPEEVRVTAFVDELPAITEVVAPAIVQDGVQCDTVLELDFLPGKYLEVVPNRLEVHIAVSRYVKAAVDVPVEYVEFPSDINLGFLPQYVNVEYEVLEANAGKVKPADFSVRLRFDDYAYSAVAGKAGDLQKRFVVSSVSPFVRNAGVVGVEAELPDSSSMSNMVSL